MKKTSACEFIASSEDNEKLAYLCGPLDQNLRQIEQALGLQLQRRGHHIKIIGQAQELAKQALQRLYERATQSLSLEEIQLELAELQHKNKAFQLNKKDTELSVLSASAASSNTSMNDKEKTSLLITRRADLRGRTPAQCDYLKAMLNHDITFGLGPAGTGKTYLAVACAVDALERDLVKRIVLTRPAVEAGERLGFLPGDLAQKVDPYLRPLYDALYDLMGFDKTQKMFERQMIEIAPLAYMRGRTLNHAFIILDEAQNTTPEQIKMFLTRIGFGSKAVVTGDTTQIDLQRGQKSGLVEAQDILKNVQGISFTHFSSADVVRHPLVARIVEAYTEHAIKQRHDTSVKNHL